LRNLEHQMNREDVIRLAREAGFDDFFCRDLTIDRFAALVADAERRACASMVDHILCEGGGTYGDAIRRRSE